MATYEDKLSVINKNLAYYNSQLTYEENIDLVKLALLEKIKNGTYKIRVIETTKNTNNRKTFYLNEQFSSFKHWNRLFKGMYIAFAIICIRIMIQTKEYKKSSVILLVLILCASPWFQSMIFAIISSGQSTANVPINDVYTEWKEDAENTLANSGSVVPRNEGANRTIYDPSKMSCSYDNSAWDGSVTQSCTTDAACTGFCDTGSGENYGKVCTTDTGDVDCGDSQYCMGTNNQGTCSKN